MTKPSQDDTTNLSSTILAGKNPKGLTTYTIMGLKKKEHIQSSSLQKSRTLVHCAFVVLPPRILYKKNVNYARIK